MQKNKVILYILGIAISIPLITGPFISEINIIKLVSLSIGLGILFGIIFGVLLRILSILEKSM